MQTVSAELPFDFVVSYNQEQREGAANLLQRLESLGLHGWIDERYYYVPLIPLERQLAKAWAKARFIIVYVASGFRNSAWCCAEYEQGLAAEKALGLTQVIVACESPSSPVPDLLGGRPTFQCDNTDGIQSIARFIEERRRCCVVKINTPKLAQRCWHSAAAAINAEKYQFDTDVLKQFEAIGTICSWIVEHLGSSASQADHEASLTIRDGETKATIALSKEDFLEAVFSDQVEVDAFPFQRVLFDLVFFDKQGEAARSELANRLMWDQLVVLSCASNRYFVSQMLERAQWIASEAGFCLCDEEAQNHFYSINGIDWLEHLAKNALLKRDNGWTFEYPLATVCEHMRLARWHEERRSPAKLLNELPSHERIDLAARAFTLLAERFVACGSGHVAPAYAVHLGLCAPGARADVHATPALALELFSSTLKDVIGPAYRVRNSCRGHAQEASSSHEIDPMNLAALKQALEEVGPAYVMYLQTAADRREGARSVEPNRGVTVTDFIAFWEYVLNGPFVLLVRANMELDSVRATMVSALNVFLSRGDAATERLAEFASDNLGRLGASDQYIDLPLPW